MQKYLLSAIAISIAFLATAQNANVGIGTNSPQTKLQVRGAISSTPAFLPAATNVVIPDNFSIFRLTAVAGGTTSDLTLVNPKEGQYLTIYNEDDNAATFYGQTIAAAGGVMNFTYINGSWRLVSDNQAGANNYVKNQTAADQSAGFRITGNGIFNGGQVGIGTSNPSSHAALDVTSTTQGVYLSRLSTTQRDVLTPSLTSTDNGLLIFNTTTDRTEFWDGTQWSPVGAGAGGPPTGAAGGDLTGTYPSPTIGVNKVTSTNILDGTITGTDIANTTIDLTSKVFNQLPVSNGGTGRNSLDANSVLVGNNASPVKMIAPSNPADLLMANNSGVPTFTPVSGDATISNSGVVALKNTGTASTYGSATQVPVLTTDAQGRVTSVTNTTITGTTPGGAAGGDLSGTYPNPTVAQIQGRPINSIAPTAGQALMWNGTTSKWEPTTVTGNVTGTGTPNYLPKWTSASNLSGTSMVFDNGTNVGIGTSSPQAVLHVNGGVRWGGGTSAPYIYSGEDATGVYLEQVGSSTTNSVLRLQSSPSGAQSSYARFVIDPVNGFAFTSGAGGNSGNVGIGTVTPGAKLEVSGNTILKTVSQGYSTTERFYPNVVSSFQNSSATTGAWIIHTPIQRASGAMVTIRVHGYGYGNGDVIDFTISGYPYGGAPYVGSIDGLPGAIINTKLSDVGTDNWFKYVGIDNAGNMAIAFGTPGISSYFYRLSVDAWITLSGNDYSTGWSIDQNNTANFNWRDITGPMTSSLKGAVAINSAGKVNITGLSTSSAVYTDGSGNLTTTIPTGSSLGYWTRSGTALYNTTTSDFMGIGLTAPQKTLDVYSPPNDFVTVAASTLGVGQWTGIHFGYRENNLLYRKSAIVFERTDNSGGGGNAAGRIHILNGPATGSGSATLADAKLTIGETGYVGVGTISPAAPFNTYATPTSGFVEQIRVGGTGNYATLQLGTYSAYDGYMATTGSDLRILSGKGVASENHAIHFYTGFNGSGGAAENNERMTIASTGNVGIGVPNPSPRFDVSGGDMAVETGQGRFKGWYNAGTGAGLAAEIGISAAQAYIYSYDRTAGTFNPLNLGGSTIALGHNGAATDLTINASGNVGVGVSSASTKLQVAGEIMRTNTRITNSQSYPLSHQTGEDMLGIDPTWTNAELQAYFNSTQVQWSNDATAPSGYAIQITGTLNVGGSYNSGFPYIPIENGATYYMECWIRSSATNVGHYMGSIEYDENFANGSGNPGSYGYWVMSNTTPGTGWVKVSGTIKGFGGSVGQFQTGKKYWTPQALFNYSNGGGAVTYISGWKVVKRAATTSGLINVGSYTDNTRQALTDAGAAVSLETFSFNKKSPTSILIISGVLSCFNGYSGGSAIGVKYGTSTEQFTTVSTYIPSYGAAIPVKCVISGYTTTGSQNVVIRVSGPYKPCFVLNPNGTDYGGMVNQTSTNFVVEEFEP